MSYGYSNQVMEIYAGADLDDKVENFSELVWELEIHLECTSPGDAGQSYGPPENCYIGWGPEFEVEGYKLTGDADVVIYDGGDRKVIAAIIGEAILDKAIDNAIEAATEEPLD